jgi:anti-anti-sigma factor
MVTFTEQDNEIICTFTGQLSTAEVMKDEPAVDQKLGQLSDRSVVFDLSKVSFVASSFLRLCLKTARAVGEGRFSVRNLTPEIKKVYVICGLDKQMVLT